MNVSADLRDLQNLHVSERKVSWSGNSLDSIHPLSRTARSVSALLAAPASRLAQAPSAAPRVPRWSATAASGALAFLFGGRPDKRVVHRNCLIEQLRAVEGFDGGFRFGLGGEFNECVALRE